MDLSLTPLSGTYRVFNFFCFSFRSLVPDQRQKSEDKVGLTAVINLFTLTIFIREIIKNLRTMPKIQLKSVKCTVPDESDKDEMYLKMNGEKIWPLQGRYHRLDADDQVDIALELDVPEGWTEVELWDYDFISRNDLLGVFKFMVDQTRGEYSTSMQVLEKNSSASYILHWAIV